MKRRKPRTVATKATKANADRISMALPLRSFSLYARFTPNGPEPADARVFREFWLEAKQRTQALRARDLKAREARFKELQSANRKVQPILRGVMRDEISVAEAARKVRRLVPDKELAAKLFEHWKLAASATPESITEQREEIAREEADLRRLTRLGNTDRALHRSLWLLSDAAMAGDADAAKCLVEAAISAATFLQMAEASNPELFRSLAGMQLRWPVLASEEAGWEKAAARRVATLDLGAGLQVFKVRFRPVRGTEANLPARLWAKAAVRVAEETRWRMFMLAQLGREFGSSGAFADFCIEAGWQAGDRPKWSREAAALAPLSQASLPTWKPVVRQMIRDEMPDFHLRPEWVNQRRTAAASGRDSVGEVQNAILDDIVSALKRLAPEKPC